MYVQVVKSLLFQEGVKYSRTDRVPVIRREHLKKFFQPLTSYKSGTRRSKAPCIASSGISDRLYHCVDLPKRVSPGIKAVPRTVLNTSLGRGIASSQQIFYEPFLVLDFCLWGTYAFSALALPLPSLAATSEGPRAVLFHLWTACGLLWKGQWMVTKKKPSLVAIGFKAVSCTLPLQA